MSVIITSGDIFQSQCEALVNPVNCDGVSGAGLALLFKNKFPHNYRDYRKHCIRGWMRLGEVFVVADDHLYPTHATKYIINFPTKDRWRNQSKLIDIQRGMASLMNAVVEWKMASVAIPALGCGLGGLEWSEVLPVIQEACERLPEKASNSTPLVEGVEVRIYAPC